MHCSPPHITLTVIVALSAASPLANGFAATGKTPPGRTLPTLIAISHQPSVISHWQHPPFIPPASGEGIEVSLGHAGFGGLLQRGELREAKSAANRFGSSIRFQQYYRDLPVIGGGVVIKLNSNGEPVSLFSSVAEWRKDVDGDADADYRMSKKDAISAALGYLSVEEMRGKASAIRAVLPRGGAPVFIWQVVVPAREPLGDWEVLVDGDTGEIIRVENRLRRVNGAGLVFDPDPKSALGNDDLQDEDDAAEAIPDSAYREVELPGIGQEEDLWVLTGEYVDTSPTANRAGMEEPAFLFNRADDRFEETMAFYHLDRQARYLVELGFEDLPPTPQLVEVNGIEDDMSFYSPVTGIITTGTGGVDDAEDADVLLHEYGHALLEQILPDWRGGEADLMTEGLCDYFAGDWSLAAAPDFQPTLLYNWDGHNEFWEGRILDADYHYPEDAAREVHDAGQLWSSLLMEIRRSAAQRDLWNAVVWEHLYALGDSATVPDAAEALLVSDNLVAGGAFRSLIVGACERRGIFAYGWHSPVISHQPPGDTEDVNAERELTATISSELPLDSARLWAIYRFGEDEADTARLESVDGEAGLFTARLPAPGVETDVYYYLLAHDTSGVFSSDPVGAPWSWHHYYAGADLIAPVISGVDSLYDTVFPEGEVVVGARVTDNIAVSDVSLVWYHGRNEPGGIVTLEADAGDSSLYLGRFRWSVAADNIIQYLVTATDAAAAGNSAVSRRQSFALQQLVVIDDFEAVNHRWRLDGWERDSSDARYGAGCLTDRPPGGAAAPRQAAATLDELWDLALFDRAQITFWERHQFDEAAGEQGWLELSADSGGSWEELLSITGSQPLWQLQEVDLSDYCYGRSEPVALRLRSETPEGADDSEGWLVDHLMLEVGSIVEARAGGEPSPEAIGLDIYPNPVNGRLVLSGRLPEAGVLSVSDVMGRIILQRQVESGGFRRTLPFDTAPAGLYLVRLEAGGRTLVKPVVVVK